MTSKLTRERLEELAAGQSGFNLRTATHEESQELACMALATMDSEPAARMVVIPTIWKYYTAAKTATIYEKAMTDAGIEWRSIDD
ncbi:TPA: hypothetical protein ACYSA1_003130 [Klebsiella oxytoca]